MNDIFDLFKQHTLSTVSKGVQDPIPLFIEKLSSGDLDIRINNDDDNFSVRNYKKNQSIRLDSNLNDTSLYFPEFRKLSQIFLNKRSPNFPSEAQKSILSKLKYIPIYTVVNRNNEVITASPRTCKDYNSLNWIQNQYNDLFLWEYDTGAVSLSLFFVNKEDAATYMHEVCKREPREAEISGLRIKTVGMDVFYRFNRTSPPHMQTRLVADLNEVNLVLRKHLKDSSHTIHPKQKYSTNWFQGSPVYIIRLQKNLQERSLVPYLFQKSVEKKVIFFNLEDAMKAWRAYNSKSPAYYYKSEPNVEIYNLENMLIDMETQDSGSDTNVVLVPAYDSYLGIKNQSPQPRVRKVPTIEKFVFNATLKLKNFHRFCKGLIWLFTSDTLPSEENSW